MCVSFRAAWSWIDGHNFAQSLPFVLPNTLNSLTSCSAFCTVSMDACNMHAPEDPILYWPRAKLYLCVCVYCRLYTSIHLYIYASIHLIHLYIYTSIQLSLSVSIHPSIHISTYLSIHLYICPSVQISIYLSVCLSIYLCIFPFYLILSYLILSDLIWSNLI